MNIFIEDDKFKVESSSKKGKFYVIDLEKKTCSCPAFIFRKSCKHLIAVQEFAAEKNSGITKRVLAYVGKAEEIDSVKLIEKFGDEPVNILLGSGELIEKHGRIRLLD